MTRKSTSNSGSSERGSHSFSATSCVSVFLVFIITTVLITWLYMHRIAVDLHDPHALHSNHVKSKTSSEANVEHMQRLIQDTKQLLHELRHANMSVSSSTLTHLKSLSQDEKMIVQDEQLLQGQVEQLQEQVSRCLNDKYHLQEDVTQCQQVNKQLQQQQHSNAVLQSRVEEGEVEESRQSLRERPSDPSPLLSSKIITTTSSTSTGSSSNGNSNNLVSNIITSATNAFTNTISSSGASKRWLVIGIPTVARLHHEDYLLQTLESIASQLPSDEHDLMYNQVLVNVVSMQVNAEPSKPHLVFQQAKEKYNAPSYPLRASFEFLELQEDEILADPIPGRNARNDQGNANKPGFLVRRQTRNIATVMRKNFRKAKYYLFLEDDMMLCWNGFLAMQYMIQKASRYHPHWLAIRASYGMNGVVMHDEDLETFANYLIDNQIRRPPDHLVVEWYAGETKVSKAYKGNRVNIGFKHNLFDHLGIISTLRSQQQTTFPRCYELLAEPTVFQVEAYSPAQCPHDDIWPCRVANPDRHLMRFD